MKYLLDTNAVIAILNGNLHFITELKKHRPTDFGLSSVVMFELYYGAEKSQKVKENLAKLAKLPFDILPFELADAKVAGKIRADLNQKGTPIGAYDLQIAAQAITRKLTLITHNVKEFERVNGLKVIDWLG